jgi:hypothetical protein
MEKELIGLANSRFNPTSLATVRMTVRMLFIHGSKATVIRQETF